MHREIVQVDAEVVKEELPPQLLQEDLELWDVDRLLKSHHHVHATLSRYGSDDSNSFIGVLPVVDLDVLVLLAVLMRGNGGLSHHRLVHVDDMKAIIIGTLQSFSCFWYLKPDLPSLDVCKYLRYPDFLLPNLVLPIDGLQLLRRQLLVRERAHEVCCSLL